YAIALKVTLRGGGRIVAGESKDLSRGGISLTAAEPFAVSDLVELEIALVFGDDSFSEPLKLPAMIVWCTRLGGGWQLGAKFVKPSKETRSYLEMFLK